MFTTRHSLLERLRSPGDQEAWSRFVHLYTPLFFSWGVKLGLQHSDVADLVQDVMALLVGKFPAFQYDSSRKFRAWLRTVFVNRQRERCRKRTETTVGDSMVFRNLEDSADVDDRADQRLLVMRGLELIRGEFSPAFWAAFQEHCQNGRPAAEVAASLGISPGTVYVAKARILSRLRQEIGTVEE